AFVLGEVFARIKPEELQVLRAALVFRNVFTFDALKAVHDAIDAQRPEIESAVRTLVRRAVLDAVTEPTLAYYLHPILCDAMQRDAGQEADAHRAAALWWSQTPFVAADVTTWDDMLYHMRRAAEIARSGIHLEEYKAVLFEYFTTLNDAGWSRRLVAELRVLAQLTSATSWAETVQHALGKMLFVMDEHDEAIAVLDRLAKGTKGQTETGARIKITLGLALAQTNRVDDALRLADELEPVVNASGNVWDELDYRDLRFEIARRKENASDMMRWAKERLELAEARAAESPLPETDVAADTELLQSIRESGLRDRVANAHFAVAMSSLKAGDLRAALNHLAVQLRIKLEIGKIG